MVDDPVASPRGRRPSWVVFLLCLVVLGAAIATVATIAMMPATEPVVPSSPSADPTDSPGDPIEQAPATAAPERGLPVVWPRDGILRVLVAGDSIGRGGFASTPTLAFPQLVVDELSLEGDVVKEGAGLTGQGAGAIASELYATGYDYDLVIVEAGTNDVPGGSVDSFGASYEVLLDVVRTRSPGAELLCLGPWAAPGEALPFNAVAEQICAEHDGVFAAVDHLFSNVDNRSTVDLFHPNDAGHAAIARVIQQHLYYPSE